MRRILLALPVLLAVAAVIVLGTGAKNGPGNPTYKIDLDNAFGLVTGAAFKVAGVPAGAITSIDLNQKTLNAVVTVKVTNMGLAHFHTSATCNSEPQSLIGEYFVACDPGTSGPLLKNGGTIPVTHTQSTIPADLLLDIMQVPERERLPLIIDSLGAGVAARSDDLRAALDRAVPALTETDNLLSLLADDSGTITQLTASADRVVSALANNSTQVQRFIDYADRAASDTADQQANLRKTLKDLPAFLQQLKPAMANLSKATNANLPALENLHAASGELDRLFTDLPSFSRSSIPAIKALGKASVIGRTAVIAAKPTVTQLSSFSQHTPELAKNLAIVTPDLNTQSNATEPNSRSPGGKGYSGLESLLQFVFNLAGATNYYGPYGHMLAVDGFLSAMCTAYATPQTIAQNLKTYGSAYRQCYAWLGPNQPGVNETDPSDPSACVPDPGGAPPGKSGPASSNCTLTASGSSSSTPARRAKRVAAGPKAGNNSTTTTNTSTSSGQPPPSNPVSKTLSGAAGSAAHTITQLGSTIGSLLNALGSHGSSSSTTSTSGTTGTSGSTNTTTTGQAQSLLKYLLSP